MSPALALLLLAARQEPRPPEFAVRVEYVNVDVLVTHGGRPLEGVPDVEPPRRAGPGP